MCKVAGSDLSKDKDLANGTSQMDGKEILDRRKRPRLKSVICNRLTLYYETKQHLARLKQ